MPEFAYTARNLTGQDVVGQIAAASRREALRVLAERSLFPLKIADAAPAQGNWQSAFKFGRKVKADVLASNLSQLADLLQNGVPPVASVLRNRRFPLAAVTRGRGRS
jgi:type II secretory pathway component PulF